MKVEAGAVVVALGLGSNLGAREEALLLAFQSLSSYLQTPRLSSPFSTPALCGPDQPRFLNAVLVASSRLDPEEIMGVAKGLEWISGRRLRPRNSPRPLDVDLLIFGDQLIQSPELVVPHPRLRERSFVLSPLAEIAPGLPIPPDGMTAAELLGNLDDDQDVEKSTWSPASI